MASDNAAPWNETRPINVISCLLFLHYYRAIRRAMREIGNGVKV